VVSMEFLEFMLMFLKGFALLIGQPNAALDQKLICMDCRHAIDGPRRPTVKPRMSFRILIIRYVHGSF
jgi:hypothetical protein